MTVPLLGLFLILTVAPVFFTTAMRDIFTLSKVLPLSIGTTLLWLALTLTGKASFKRSLTPGIVAVLAVAGLSACFSVDKPLSILGPHQQQFYALLPLSLCALAYYAAANMESVPPSAFVLLSLLGGIAVSAVALTQIGGHGFMPWTIQDGRSGSTFGSPIFLGSYLAMLLPLAWADKSRSRWAVILIIGAALLATGSRGSILAAASGVLLIEYLRNKKIAGLIGIILPIILVVVIMRLARSSSASDIGRFEVWRIAIISWKSHPWLGWGPDTFSLAFRQFMTQRFVDANGNDRVIQLSAHNDVLQVLTTMGLLGLAAYALLLTKAVGLLRIARNRALGIVGALAALFVNAKFNPIPLAVLVVAACLLGSLDRGEPAPAARTKAALAAAASMFLALIFGVMCVAERCQRIAENLAQVMPVQATAQFNIAAQINPFTLWYTQRQLDYFWTVFPAMPGAELQSDRMAGFSHRVAERNAQLHPNDPTAHELRALSYLFEGKIQGRIFLKQVDQELAIAERLAPRFSSYTLRRAEIARILR